MLTSASRPRLFWGAVIFGICALFVATSALASDCASSTVSPRLSGPSLASLAANPSSAPKTMAGQPAITFVTFAGFSGNQLVIAVAVGYAESNLSVNCASPNGTNSTDYGLWQLNDNQPCGSQLSNNPKCVAPAPGACGIGLPGQSLQEQAARFGCDVQWAASNNPNYGGDGFNISEAYQCRNGGDANGEDLGGIHVRPIPGKIGRRRCSRR